MQILLNKLIIASLIMFLKEILKKCLNSLMNDKIDIIHLKYKKIFL